MPEARKNEIVGATVGTILRIAVRGNVYDPRQIQEPRTIYDNRNDEERPEIISDINKYLKEGLSKMLKLLQSKASQNSLRYTERLYMIGLEKTRSLLKLLNG